MSETQRSVPPSNRRRPAATTVLRAAWIAVLAIAAAFHVLRGAPLDAAIYAVGAVLLVLDALGWLNVPLRMPADRDSLSRRVVAGTLIVLASLAFGATRLYGPADTAIVLGLGVLLLPVAWADRRAPAAKHADVQVRRAAIAWSIVITAFCVWEIGVFFVGRDLSGSQNAFPALSDLVDPLLAWPPARALLGACWLVGGYALLRRGGST